MGGDGTVMVPGKAVVVLRWAVMGPGRRSWVGEGIQEGSDGLVMVPTQAVTGQ